MPCYFFDILDGSGVTIDDEGRDLENLEDARIEAAMSLVDITKDSLRISPGEAIHRLSIQVRDDAGPVMNVGFRFDIHKKN